MTSTIVPPVDLAPGMPSRVVTISATDVTEGGQSLEGQMVRFALSDTLDVSSGGDVIAKTQAEVVLDANGEGRIRLPVYDEDVKTWCGKDWAILVTATWGSQKAIRVPAGTSSIALSSLPPVRPLRGRELQWAVTGASVTVTEGAAWDINVALQGGVLGFDFTVPANSGVLDGSRAAMIVSAGDPILLDLDAGTLTIPPTTRVLVDSRNTQIVAAGSPPMVIPIPADSYVRRIFFDTTKPHDPSAFVFPATSSPAPNLATHVLLGAYSGWGDGSAYLHGGPYEIVGASSPVDIPDGVKAAQIVTFGGRFEADWTTHTLHIPQSSHVFVDDRWVRMVSAAGTPLQVPLPTDTNIYRIFFDTTKPDTADAFVFRAFSADVTDLMPTHLLIGVTARPKLYLGGVPVPTSEDPPLNVPDGSVTEEKLAPSVRKQLGQGGALALTPVPATGYQAPVIEGYDAATLDPKQPADLYAAYDALPTIDEGTMTVRTLGYSQLADGTADTSLPILEYHYAPYRAEAQDVPVPRLLIQAGIHGYEKAAAYAAFQWLRDVLTGSSEMSVWVRRHIDIHLVPIANPYSFAHNRRHNVNDVDINTNFEHGWVSRTKPDPYNPGSLWGGPAPMSEMETQVLDAWYAELAGEAIGLLDLHNIAGPRTLDTGAHGVTWLISADQRVRTLARQIIEEASRRWRAEFPELAALPPNVVFGDTNDRVDGTARNQAWEAYGIPPVTVDTLWSSSSLPFPKYGENVMRVNVDTLGLAVQGFVRNFL